MAKSQVALIGPIVGTMHQFTSLFSDGRSLHPMQRIGDVPHSGLPNFGAASVPGFQHGPPAGGPDTSYPHILDPSITTAMNPAARV